MSNQKLGWVLPKIIEQNKGITVGALTKQKQRGKLIEGVHWKKVLGRIWYHYEKFDEMINDAA
jgi:hypothetical protein